MAIPAVASPSPRRVPEMKGVMLKPSDLEAYQEVVLKWYKEISCLRLGLSSFDEDDQEIIKSSFRVVNLLLDALEEPGDHKFLAAISNTTQLKIYALGMFRFAPASSQLLLLATRPKNLPLKDRMNDRVSGGGSAVIRSIMLQTEILWATPNRAARSFYHKLGFITVDASREPHQLKLVGDT